MVGMQCKDLVREELKKLKIPVKFLRLGVVELFDDVTVKKREQLKVSLLPLGLKLHQAKKGLLIEKIKDTIKEMILCTDGHPVASYSVYLSEKLEYDYTYLANIFSEVNGITIQQYIIFSKIEEVKKLLVLSDLNLSQISYKLHYSSVAHLSGQFKKITGLSPSAYKLMKQNREELAESF